MPLLDLIPAPYRVLAAGIAILALCAASAFSTYKVEEWRWASAVSDQKEEAAKVLVNALNVARQQEKEAGDLNLAVETKHAQDQKIRADQLAAALADARRLRDPGRRPGCDSAQGGTAAAPGGSDGTSSGNELSQEAGDFLRRFANQCDRVSDQFLGCQEYALNLWRICGDERR